MVLLAQGSGAFRTCTPCTPSGWVAPSSSPGPWSGTRRDEPTRSWDPSLLPPPGGPREALGHAEGPRKATRGHGRSPVRPFAPNDGRRALPIPLRTQGHESCVGCVGLKLGREDPRVGRPTATEGARFRFGLNVCNTEDGSVDYFHV